MVGKNKDFQDCLDGGGQLYYNKFKLLVNMNISFTVGVCGALYMSNKVLFTAISSPTL